VRPLLPEQRRGTNGMQGNVADIELCRDRLSPGGLTYAGYAYVVEAPPIRLAELAAWTDEVEAWIGYWKPMLELDAAYSAREWP
jgi:hypothetical protein